MRRGPDRYDRIVNETGWSLDPGCGELDILTGVAGPAAKMGHRLTIVLRSWRANVQWRGPKPVAAELSVDLDSLEVVRGEGGVTPLTGPEKSVARLNALKSLNAKKYPRVQFTADDITATDDGYRLTGSVEIHGTSQPQTVDLTIVDRGQEWGMSTRLSLTQSAFGIKPFSLMMGTLRVADEVTLEFSATHPK